jgi:hypothetical protein
MCIPCQAQKRLSSPLHPEDDWSGWSVVAIVLTLAGLAWWHTLSTIE